MTNDQINYNKQLTKIKKIPIPRYQNCIETYYDHCFFCIDYDLLIVIL